MEMEVEQTIRELLMPILQEAHVELVELNVRPYQGTVHIQILTDRERGGITLDECTFVNRQIANKIEEGKVIAGDCEIEVSSPGLDRPLKTYKDFLRIIGQPVRFHLSDFLNNKKEYMGVVMDAQVDNIMVQTKQAEIAIPLNIIHKAVVII